MLSFMKKTNRIKPSSSNDKSFLSFDYNSIETDLKPPRSRGDSATQHEQTLNNASPPPDSSVSAPLLTRHCLIALAAGEYTAGKMLHEVAVDFVLNNPAETLKEKVVEPAVDPQEVKAFAEDFQGAVQDLGPVMMDVSATAVTAGTGVDVSALSQVLKAGGNMAAGMTSMANTLQNISEEQLGRQVMSVLGGATEIPATFEQEAKKGQEERVAGIEPPALPEFVSALIDVRRTGHSAAFGAGDQVKSSTRAAATLKPQTNLQEEISAKAAAARFERVQDVDKRAAAKAAQYVVPINEVHLASLAEGTQ